MFSFTLSPSLAYKISMGRVRTTIFDLLVFFTQLLDQFLNILFSRFLLVFRYGVLLFFLALSGFLVKKSKNHFQWWQEESLRVKWVFLLFFRHRFLLPFFTTH